MCGSGVHPGGKIRGMRVPYAGTCTWYSTVPPMFFCTVYWYLVRYTGIHTDLVRYPVWNLVRYPVRVGICTGTIYGTGTVSNQSSLESGTWYGI